MKYLILLIAALSLRISVGAQTEKVNFSYSENSFDGNMPLPSEQKFMIKGRVSADVDIVEVSVFRDIRSGKKPLFTTQWHRGQDALADEFSIMMHQKLKQDTEYDFSIRYFRQVTTEERDYTIQQLKEQLTLYLDNHAEKEGKHWAWEKNTNALVKDMDKIILDGLKDFTNDAGVEFDGFSDNVQVTLENVEEHTERMKKNDSTATLLLSQSGEYFDKLTGQLINEVMQYTHGGLYYAFDERQVQKYSTDKLKNILSISAGYGGVIFNDKKNNGKYDHAPYVGISVPFGNRAMRKPFWSNLSLSTGVFLLNFEDNDGNKVSGPVIQRPIYLGMGYKFLRFVKIQGGVTVLETKVEDGNFVNFDQVYFRPYVGIGLEFNFWMDFAK